VAKHAFARTRTSVVLRVAAALAMIACATVARADTVPDGEAKQAFWTVLLAAAIAGKKAIIALLVAGAAGMKKFCGRGGRSAARSDKQA
jgi:hypothetical protein